MDMYQLTMSQSYWRSSSEKIGTFELYFRAMPKDRNYLVLFGIEKSIERTLSLSFDKASIDALSTLGKFDQSFLEYLEKLSFTGTVWTMSDGDIIFPNEPVIQIQAPIIQCQMLETMLINTINLRTLLATKCSRVIQAANGKPVIDFGARRAHGIESAEALAEASYLTGFSATATVSAGIKSGLPIAGTMAHSYVMSFKTELEAFRAYATEFPNDCVLLVDTYDTAKGIQNAILVAKEMESSGKSLKGIRLDSGDLAAHSLNARSQLNAAGLSDVNVLASGGLDEYEIANLESAESSIDGYGVGTKVGVSSDAPWSESVYKMVDIDGLPVNKTSEGKQSAPGKKIVVRENDQSGMFLFDKVYTSSKKSFEDPNNLLKLRINKSQNVINTKSLRESKTNHDSQITSLPAKYKSLSKIHDYRVDHSYLRQDKQ